MIVARKNERGQAIVLMVLALVVLLGMAALVLDVGNWFHTKRRLQATSDAAALAGAQKLPEDPSGAATMATLAASAASSRSAGTPSLVFMTTAVAPASPACKTSWHAAAWSGRTATASTTSCCSVRAGSVGSWMAA